MELILFLDGPHKGEYGVGHLITDDVYEILEYFPKDQYAQASEYRDKAKQIKKDMNI